MSLEYWRICIEESSAAGALSKEQIASLAEDIQASHEMYGEATGLYASTAPAPNEPSKSDLMRKIKLLEDRVAELEYESSSYKEAFAKRVKVPSNEIWLDRGEPVTRR